MTLTKDVLKRIIKEELEKLVADQQVEEVDPVDAEIAALEQQLAEAKKSKAMKKMKGAHADHKMKPLKAKK
jgi:glutamyl-tRNA reductase